MATSDKTEFTVSLADVKERSKAFESDNHGTEVVTKFIRCVLVKLKPYAFGNEYVLTEYMRRKSFG